MRDITQVMIIAICKAPIAIDKIEKALIYQFVDLKNELSLTYLIPEEFMYKLNQKCAKLTKPYNSEELILLDTEDILADYENKQYILLDVKLIISPVTNHIVAVIPDEMEEYVTALEYVSDVLKGESFTQLN